MNLVPTHSNCTSPMDYISHHALHSHIPVHHYTNHTAVTIHSSLWLPHHTCTSFSHSHKAAHKHSPSAKSCFPLVTFLSVLPFILLSLCLTLDCPTLELWTCACDLDLCLVLFTSLLCLWYSCYARWPLPVWFCRCLLNIYYCTWIPCLWPVFTLAKFDNVIHMWINAIIVLVELPLIYGNLINKCFFYCSNVNERRKEIMKEGRREWMILEWDIIFLCDSPNHTFRCHNK